MALLELRHSSLVLPNASLRILKKRGSDLMKGRSPELKGGRDPELLKTRAHSIEGTQPLICEGCGLQNVALEASHAVYRDVMISLELSRQSRS